MSYNNSMDYIALYRKYRPQTFDEVVEQDSVVKILREELRKGKISHAYLFAGPKGSGKTTVARILAKGLNCEKGPTDKPCLKCKNCVEIAKGTSLDVVEIDAASNRGIDEIRDLKEKVQYVPANSKYKVYIIDEAHMLTPQAFNALLKTLEEPPLNVVFILATTEPDKLPTTILSRCERLFFKPISINGLSKKVVEIAKKEDAKITVEAANLIARMSSGSLRNALSILEEVLTVSDDITEEVVRKLLDIPEERFVLNFGKALMDSDANKIFGFIEQSEKNSFDPKILLNELIEFFEDLITLRLGDSQTVSEKRSEEMFGDMKELLKSLSFKKLIDVSKMLLDLQYQLKLFNEPYFAMLLEMLNFAKVFETFDRGLPKEEVKEAPIEEKAEEVEAPIQTEEKAPTPETVPTNEAEKTEMTIDRMKALWDSVLAGVKEKNVPLSVILQKVQIASLDKDSISLIPEKAFYLQQLRKPESIQILEEQIKKVTNLSLRVVFIEPKEELRLSKDEKIKELEKDKDIQEILGLFEGTITDVKEEKDEKL